MFFDNINIDNSINEKFLKNYFAGNLYLNEYVPYKNYPIYRIRSKNEKEQLLLNIMIERFITNDLALVLDINPDNTTLFSMLDEHNKLLEKYIDEYETKYNALSINGKMNNYNWVNNFSLEGLDV